MPRALLLKSQDSSPEVVDIQEADLPAGEVLVRVLFSSLNYKDALALKGLGRVVRSYPMVPGIDLAGVVERSDSPAWQPGQEVLLTGWGMGESHWGGFAQLARVDAGWLL